MSWRVELGDCVERMAAMAPASIDAIVCDPPYGLEFMGKEWDRLGDVARANRGTQPDRKRPAGEAGKSAKFQLPAPAFDLSVSSQRAMQEWHEAWAREALRVLKPGGHLLAFGGTRTYHRLACAVEDAGFAIRDCLQWWYGSGFPKSLDVSKAIDKAAGAEREVIGQRIDGRYASGFSEAAKKALGSVVASESETGFSGAMGQVTAPATPEAERWEGWGTALKPAYEPIVMARKPLTGTVAANVLEHGTGALNIDGCRIAGAPDSPGSTPPSSVNGQRGSMAGPMDRVAYDASRGRWPANVLLSHSEECVPVGDGSSVADSNGGGLKGQDGLEERSARGEMVEVWACVPGCPVRMLDDQTAYGDFEGQPARGVDRGGASRFFYCAKASRAERGAGVDANAHPTVKPIEVMRWLVRLVTPPGGVVLDPFAGSGSTGCAAVLEGFEFVGIERDAEYARIAEARVGWWASRPPAPVREVLARAARPAPANSPQDSLFGD